MTYPTDYLSELREQKDDEFKNSPYSPLTPEQQRIFTGLAYYEANPDLEFLVLPLEFQKKEPVRMMTSTNEIRSYLCWGTISFTAGDSPVVLTLYAVPGQSAFFLPFMDLTTGHETYGAGRYVEVEAQPDGRLRIDFNEAYNPYCAYNKRWSCPLVPEENRLTVALPAGEKLPEGAWVNL